LPLSSIMEILSDIPVSLDAGKVLERMNIRKKREDMEKGVQKLIEVVLPIARPKVIYQVSYVDNKNEDSVEVDGVRFTSRVLRDNLDKVGRVFPFVATCGRELGEIDIPADELELAMSYLEEHLTRKYDLGQISEMEPGSLESWPITQQKELFSIFGNVEDAIGVRLTDKCLMIPVKSVSGVYFPTEIKFESCQLCTRERCIGRKAPYNPDLAGKYSEEVAG